MLFRLRHPLFFRFERPGIGVRQLNDVMNFVMPFARTDKAGEHHPGHAFLDENGVTDFELRFVGAPYQGLACRFLHISIVAHVAERGCAQSREQNLPALSLAAAARTIAPGPICLRTGLIDDQRSVFELPTIQSGDCFRCFSIVRHFDESETTWLSGFTIGDDINPLHGSVLFKKRTDNGFRCRKTQIPNIDFLHF
jgi:hypothetical protein